MSAMVPAPTACTAAAAPPLRTRKTMNMAALMLTALIHEKITNSKKDMMYTLRRPLVSEKYDLSRPLTTLHH
jgi:hypothetical protein